VTGPIFHAKQFPFLSCFGARKGFVARIEPLCFCLQEARYTCVLSDGWEGLRGAHVVASLLSCPPLLQSRKSSRLWDGSSFQEIRYLTIVRQPLASPAAERVGAICDRINTDIEQVVAEHLQEAFCSLPDTSIVSENGITTIKGAGHCPPRPGRQKLSCER